MAQRLSGIEMRVRPASATSSSPSLSLSPRYDPATGSTLQEGKESCLDCLQGYYCPDQASTEVTLCPAGSYCPEGTDVPELCPAGTYSPSPGIYNQSHCIACDAGK